MGTYSKILIAVDLRVTHDVYTLERGIELAQDSKADLYLIHVLEPMHNYGSMQAQTLAKMEKDIKSDARKVFQDFTSNYDITADQLILETGSPRKVIVDQAKKLEVALIVVGVHKKHGLEYLVGSTAIGVLNQAYCDVLAIRCN